jgi:hypothetical protein
LVSPIDFESCDVGQVPDLPSTAPGTKLGGRNKSRLDRFPFNVTGDSPEFGGIPNPVIVRFVLPEAGSPSFQNLIGNTSAAFLHSAGNRRQRGIRLNQNMHMVRHQNPGEQIVQLPDVLATIQSLYDCLCDTIIYEPHRSGRRPVQNPICSNKSLAGSSRPHKHPSRQTSVQSPRQENRGPLRLPVWQTALINLHTSLQCAQLRNFSLGRSGTCPTFLLDRWNRGGHVRWDRGGYV